MQIIENEYYKNHTPIITLPAMKIKPKSQK